MTLDCYITPRRDVSPERTLWNRITKKKQTTKKGENGVSKV